MVERERRFLVRAIPDGVVDRVEIVDRYLAGTRLRLREVRSADGSVVRKLGQKIRLSDGPAEVACTTVYLDDVEWSLMVDLPSRLLHKTRHFVERDGLRVAVDEHEDGSLVAEIDDGVDEPVATPRWLEILADVSDDEDWTGAALARRAQP